MRTGGCETEDSCPLLWIRRQVNQQQCECQAAKNGVMFWRIRIYTSSNQRHHATSSCYKKSKFESKKKLLKLRSIDHGPWEVENESRKIQVSETSGKYRNLLSYTDYYETSELSDDYNNGCSYASITLDQSQAHPLKYPAVGNRPKEDRNSTDRSKMPKPNTTKRPKFLRMQNK
jgi:hypothetical protein